MHLARKLAHASSKPAEKLSNQQLQNMKMSYPQIGMRGAVRRGHPETF